MEAEGKTNKLSDAQSGSNWTRTSPSPHRYQSSADWGCCGWSVPALGEATSRVRVNPYLMLL